MLFPTLLVLCFAIGFIGIASARTDGSVMYVAFCVLSPVLLPIWIGMQVGEWFGNKCAVAAAKPEATRARPRMAFVRSLRSRAMATRSSYVAPVAQH